MYNSKRIVAQGYDIIKNNYLKIIKSVGSTVREKYVKIIENELPDGANILDLGCGAGIPITKRLSSRFQIIGVDISIEQLLLATSNVPDANFILADMTQLSFPDSIFDAVVAFYSITHVPRDEHIILFSNIYRMLKPKGLWIATLGYGDLPDTIEPDWLGRPMFFSHFNGNTNVELVNKAGFEIISATDEKELENEKTVCFRWIVARKPASYRP